jgi:hypothetical protein
MCPFAETLQQLLGFLEKRFAAFFSARICLAYSIFRFVMTHLRHGPGYRACGVFGLRAPAGGYRCWMATLFFGSGDEI